MGVEALHSWNRSTSEAYANLQTWHSLAGAQPLAGNFPPATSAPGGTTHMHVHLQAAELPLSAPAHQLGYCPLVLTLVLPHFPPTALSRPWACPLPPGFAWSIYPLMVFPISSESLTSSLQPYSVVHSSHSFRGPF